MDIPYQLSGDCSVDEGKDTKGEARNEVKES